jgi:hypothetical protein
VVALRAGTTALSILAGPAEINSSNLLVFLAANQENQPSQKNQAGVNLHR